METSRTEQWNKYNCDFLAVELKVERLSVKVGLFMRRHGGTLWKSLRVSHHLKGKGETVSKSPDCTKGKPFRY